MDARNFYVPCRCKLHMPDTRVNNALPVNVNDVAAVGYSGSCWNAIESLGMQPQLRVRVKIKIPEIRDRVMPANHSM